MSIGHAMCGRMACRWLRLPFPAGCYMHSPRRQNESIHLQASSGPWTVSVVCLRGLGDYMTGMLFLFETAQPQTFWMRNTPSSLDMMFIDAGGKVINTAAYTTPMSDQLYSSAGPAKYVVEAKAGFADRFGIRQGYTMRWKRLR